MAAYIQRDLALRTSPDHSETLALFMALLFVYMDLGRLVPQERLNARSQQAIHGWWHGFFSFVDSGPPAHRLQEMLALHRAGYLQFLGPGMWVRADQPAALLPDPSSHRSWWRPPRTSRHACLRPPWSVPRTLPS